MHEHDVLRSWHRLRVGSALEKRTRCPARHHAHKRSTVHEKSPVEIHLGRTGFNIIASRAAKRTLYGHCESNIREACDGSADDVAVFGCHPCADTLLLCANFSALCAQQRWRLIN